MVAEESICCRKCSASNPPGNQYCRKCGAVLSVSTTMLNAQQGPVTPRDLGFKWRYVWIGVFVMLGLTTAAIGSSILLGLRIGVEEKGIVGGIAAFSATIGGILLISFGLSGFLLGLLAGRAVPREAFLAAALVITLLGVVGCSLTFDLLIAAGVLLLPTGFSAWMGARLRGTQ